MDLAKRSVGDIYSATSSKEGEAMTDLQRMILAARQIGEVVGEDLLAGLVTFEGQPTVYLAMSTYDSMGYWMTCNHALPDDHALDLLTGRVLGSLWKWSRSMKVKRTSRNDMSGNVVVAEHGIGIHWTPQDVFGTGYKDLPSAVAAIHKHWKEQNNA